MHPILYNHSLFVLPSWHVCFLLGTIAAYIYFKYLTKHFYPKFLKFIPSLFISSYIGALFGGRFLSCIVELDHFSIEDFFSFDSLTFYGGFLGAWFATSLNLFLKHLPWRVFWDLMIPPLFLGLAIGRFGCFLNGDDFGIPIDINHYPSTPWWAVSFPNHLVQIPRYPVQLMESGCALLICFLGGLNFHRIHFYRIGLVGSLSILIYACCRYILEFYRDDDRGWIMLHYLSTSQGISLLLAGALIIDYSFSWHFRKHSKYEVNP